MAENIAPDAIFFRPAAEVLGIDPTARRALIVLETGEPFAKASQWMRYEMTAGACDLSILNAGRAPLLNSHGYQVSDILGVIECAWLDKDERGRTVAKCIARFSRNKSGKSAWRDVHDGILNYSSIGAETITAEQEGGILTVRRWRPYEVSLCPMPANRTCGTTVAKDVDSSDLATMVSRQRAEQTVFRDILEGKRLRADDWREWADETGARIAEKFGIDLDAVRQFLKNEADGHLTRLVGIADEFEVRR